MTKRYETFPVRPEAEDLSRDLAHYQDNRIRPCSSEILQPVQRGLLSKDYLSWRFTQQRSRSDSYRNRGQIRFHVFKDTACRPGPAPCAAAKSTNKKTLDNLHKPFRAANAMLTAGNRLSNISNEQLIRMWGTSVELYDDVVGKYGPITQL